MKTANGRRLSDHGGGEERPPSSLLEAIGKLRHAVEAFDALRWKQPRDYSFACTRVLAAAREVIAIVFPPSERGATDADST